MLYSTTQMRSGTHAALALITALAVSLASCGRPHQKSAEHGSSTTNSNATASVLPPTPPEEDMLRDALANPVFLDLGMKAPDQYCEPLNPNDVARLSVSPAVAGRSLYIDHINTTKSQHDAVLTLLHPTLASTSTGLISGGNCYAVDPTLTTKYFEPGVGVSIPLGMIRAKTIERVNDFQVTTAAGSAQARSYHVDYVIDGAASGGQSLEGVTDVSFKATCVLVHDNVENRWTIQSCQPTN